MPNEEYYSQVVDYIGFLNAELRGLKGISTLANELIQNAEDAHATHITFDVRDEALIVYNDALFADCGDIRSKICSMEQRAASPRLCDFHRFRRVASGNKRTQGDTIGAFGVGFISVYQITDRPEILSGTRHWIISPEAEPQIRESLIPYYGGTQFVLPWAITPGTEIRTALAVPPIAHHQLRGFAEELKTALPQSLPFLQHLKTVTLKRNGEVIRENKVFFNDHGLEIRDGVSVAKWYLIRASFRTKGEQLRQQSGVPHKRKTDVCVAIPLGEANEEGLLYAYLSTQHTTSLRFHINADFFPTTDRKRVILGDDYQGRWNKTAVETAADALAEHVTALTALLGHEAFWKLMKGVKDVHQQSSGVGGETVFRCFWEKLKVNISKTEVVFTSKGEWRRPEESFLLRDGEEREVVGVLEELGLHIVHEDLRPRHNLLMEIGVPYLKATDLAGAITNATGDKGAPVHEADEWLRDADNRALLGREMRRLLERASKEEGSKATEQFRHCFIAVTHNGWMARPVDVCQARPQVVRTFDLLGLSQHFLHSDNPENIQALSQELTPRLALALLEKVPVSSFSILWNQHPQDAVELVNWFASSAGDLTDDDKRKLRALPLWPSGGGLYPLDELVVPGDFIDPLRLSKILDLEALPVERDFLFEIGAEELNVVTYASDQVPQAFATADIAPDICRRLLEILTENFKEIGDSAEVRDALAGCPLVECDDGNFRVADEVYFRSEEVEGLFGKGTPWACVPYQFRQAAGNFLAWLGVTARPRLFDIVKAARSLTGKPPTGDGRERAKKIFTYLWTNWETISKSEDKGYLDGLLNLAWLPAKNDALQWFASRDVFSSHRERLFSTQAKILDVPTLNLPTKLHDFLGIRIEPTVEMVVRHLAELVRTGTPVHPDVYTFLDQNASHIAVKSLTGQRWLFIDALGTYLKSNQVFWGDHPFGAYRYRLAPEMRSYARLLGTLGVRENPLADDAAGVLAELSEKSGNTELNEEDESIVYACWGLLRDAPDNVLSPLKDKTVIPNNRRLLQKPSAVFFDDRPQIAGLLGLTGSVIPRPKDVWRSMREVGVRNFSEVLSTTLSEAGDQEYDGKMTDTIRSRSQYIFRIIEAQVGESGAEWDVGALAEITVKSASNLTLQYSVESLKKRTRAQATAYYDPEGKTLYYLRGAPLLHVSVARELSHALLPDADPGAISLSIKEILSADTAEEAVRVLNAAGFTVTSLAQQESSPESIVVNIASDVSPSPQEEIAVPLSQTSAEASEEDDEMFKTTTSDVEGEQVLEGEEIEEDLGVTETQGGVPSVSGQPSSRNRVDISQGFRTGGGAAGTNNKGGGAPATNAGGTANLKDDKAKQGGQTKRSSRLISYVETGESNDADDQAGLDPEVVERKRRVAEAGVKRAMEYEKQAGRTPHEMDHNNKGFDIKSLNDEGKIERLIEVKAVSGKWNEVGVLLTKDEYDFARDNGARSWLYVVERAEEEDSVPYRIQDPASKITHYGFDHGWKKVGYDDTE